MPMADEPRASSPRRAAVPMHRHSTPDNMNEKQDRASGCLLGLAVGDALGTTLEFTRPGGFEPITDMLGGGPFGLQAGEWTDDTSMALCLAESLVLHGFDPKDQIERYIRWWKEGHMSSTGRCFDIGNTVRGALSCYLRTGEPNSGGSDEYSAGNGSIMRLAPVPVFFSGPAEAVFHCAESSRTTHQAPAAIDACRYLGGILWGLIHGANKNQVLSPLYHPAGETWNDLHPAIRGIAEGSFKQRNPPEIRGSGYVVQSLEAALWAFHHAENFKHGALLAVNLGEDADTTGAIYGQIAGAFHGRSGIPPEWIKRLARLPLIEELTDRLTGHLK
jgi:ADP-ribosyl-[dinitrogen reductase] hydrolase